MSTERQLIGCALHDGADIDACGCPALDSPGAIAYRGLLVKARAEIARLTAELAAAREAAQRDRDVAQSMAKAAHDAEEQLAAARAVPADVEAVIGDLKIAAADFGIAQDGVATGCAFATEHRGEASARMRSATDALRTAIARAISEAEQRAVGDFLDRAKTLSTGAGTGKSPVEAAILDYRNAVADWEHDDPISGSGKDAERRQCDAYIALLAAISDATAAPATVGGLLATACVLADDLSATCATHDTPCDWGSEMGRPGGWWCPVSGREARSPGQRGPLLAATAPVRPGPDCPMCNGEACDKCNPGPGRPRCDRDGQERHELPTAAPRPQCPTHGDTVNCYCTTGALHCHDCGHTPPFCTACDGYHDDGPCPLPKGG